MKSGSFKPLRPGNPIGDDDAEQYLVICMPEGRAEFFADDVRTSCVNCGRAIHHRPYAPKRAPKVCIACFVINFDGE